MTQKDRYLAFALVCLIIALLTPNMGRAIVFGALTLWFAYKEQREGDAV